jgi:hypothetical protein
MIIVTNSASGIREPGSETRHYEDEILYAGWAEVPVAALAMQERAAERSTREHIAETGRLAAATLADPDFIGRVYRAQR